MKLRQKPSGIWVVDFEEDGQRRRVSTGIKTVRMRNAPPDVRAKAKDVLLGLVPQTASVGKSRVRGGHVTMRDLFERALRTVWHPSQAKSQGTILSNVKILNTLIGDDPIQDMTYTRLEQLVETLKGRGYAPATIKRKLDMVSKALRMATKWTDAKGQPLLLAKPPMPTIRVANMKDRVISAVEETAIFQAIEKRRQDEPERQWFRFAALIAFLSDTAARLGEAIGSLGPDNVQVDGHPMDIKSQVYDGTERAYVTFARYRTKNDQPRTIPLTPRAWRALLSLLPHLGRGREDRWLFFPMTPGTAWYMFDQIRTDLTKVGLDLSDAVLHTFRHTALTRLAQGGMELMRLQKWAGHSDPKITAMRYTHLVPSDLDYGIDILSNNTNPPIQRPVATLPEIETFTDRGVNRAKPGTGAIH